MGGEGVDIGQFGEESRLSRYFEDIDTKDTGGHFLSMGWARTLLLGDIGNRLDIADTEEEIRRMQAAQRSAKSALQSKDQKITMLKDELGKQKLAIQALTRFLIEKEMIKSEELADFITQIDAEDGVIDGKMEIDTSTRRLRFEKKSVPPGVFKKG